MTVAWDQIETALVAFIESTGVVKPGRVMWEREANPIAYDDVVELRILREDSIGFDDVEDVEVSPGIFVPRVTGLREFTLSIRMHSRSEKTAARRGLEKIRSYLHHPRLIQTLSDAGVAYLSTEPLATLDPLFAGRFESVAELDVRFGVLSELFEPSTDSSAESLASVGVTVSEVDALGVTVANQTISIPE